MKSKKSNQVVEKLTITYIFSWTLPDEPADPKEVELTEVDKLDTAKNQQPEQANRRRRDNFLHPRGLGRRAGDAILVGDCWSFRLYYLLVYQEISSVASVWRVGIYRVCGVVHVVKLTKSFYVEKIAKSHSIKVKRKKKSAFIVIRYKNMFNLNGVFFLWKLYFFEFIESIIQIVNVTTVYLCTIPIEATISFCIVLAFDAFYRAYQLKQKTRCT